MTILLADDDVTLATFLSKSLESEGHEVHTALDEAGVLKELQRQSYKLIILDLNFGKTDGLRLLKRFRAEGVSTPVIVLSARNKISDRIESLNLGADDYMTKPFSFQELMARANALLRRKADPSLNLLRVADLELDPSTRRVARAGREIKLSSKEYHLLHLLMRRAGNQVTRQELLHDVWGLPPGSDSNLVDVYVNYLRRKLEYFLVVDGVERIDEANKLIHTVRGVGYRIGPEASLPKVFAEAAQGTLEPSRGDVTIAHATSPLSGLAQPAVETPWRALVNSLAHDLAQPLTNVRCFLEVAAMRKGNLSASASDLRAAEQQADRAIVLAKTISALVREVSVQGAPWISLNALLQHIFDDFVVLEQSGLLTVERRWDNTIQVASRPVLRPLLVLLAGKVAAKNARPVTLTVFAVMAEGRCHLEMRWRASDHGTVQDAESIFAADLAYIQEMVDSIGGEIALEGEAGISLKLPGVLQPSQNILAG